MSASFRDGLTTTPVEARIVCVPSAATHASSVFRCGCTSSQIFLFAICIELKNDVSPKAIQYPRLIQQKSNCTRDIKTVLPLMKRVSKHNSST